MEAILHDRRQTVPENELLRPVLRRVHAETCRAPVLLPSLCVSGSEAACRGTQAAPVRAVRQVVQCQQSSPHRKRDSAKERRHYFTRHAVEQYIDRCHRGIGFHRALRELVAMSAGAHFVKRLDSGADYWRGPPPMRLRLLVDPGEDGGLMQVVTVLPASDAWVTR